MKVALFGATGQLGRRLLADLLDQGHEPIVLVRDPSKLTVALPDENVLEGDCRDMRAVGKALHGCQAVISALGMADISVPATDLSDCLRAIVHQMPLARIRRLVAIGGAGVLPHPVGGLLKDHDWPDYLKNVSAEHERQWQILRSANLDWTLVCPAFFHDDEPEATVRVKAEADPGGSDMVTIENLADFVTDEVTACRFVRQRVGIVSDRPQRDEVFED